MSQISVIVPVFNRPVQLRESVESALSQTLPPAEVIIVDDGSDDDTPAAAEDLASKNPGVVRVIRTANGGPGRAREAGRLAARGEFLQYLDSDDVLYPRKLELQMECLARHPMAAACYGPVRYRYASGVLADDPIKLTGQSIAEMFPSFLGSRWWSTHAPLWRRTITDPAGPWLGLRIHEDWEYDCRIAAAGGTLCRVSDDVAEVREASGPRDHRFNRNQLPDRAKALGIIWKHACQAGLSPEIPEARRFSALAFFLSRDCAFAGLSPEASHLLEVAFQSGTAGENRRWPRLLYARLAALLGFRIAGHACIGFETVFRRG